jgi:hypothetical protein
LEKGQNLVGKGGLSLLACRREKAEGLVTLSLSKRVGKRGEYAVGSCELAKEGNKQLAVGSWQKERISWQLGVGKKSKRHKMRAARASAIAIANASASANS